MGLSQPADQMEAMAAELEDRITEWLDEGLTLEQSARESRHTYNHLQASVADGKLPHAGERGEPRIRRRDLPVKGGHRGAPSIAEMVLAGAGVYWYFKRKG